MLYRIEIFSSKGSKLHTSYYTTAKIYSKMLDKYRERNPDYNVVGTKTKTNWN